MDKCCERKTERTVEDKKTIISRLNRISGQVEGIKRMINEDRYCDDVLIQLLAVDKSLRSIANFIIEKHMYNCVLENIKAGNTEILSEVVNLFKRFQ